MALAVAVSVAVEDYHRRPVVVMVPPSLQEKWPTDYQLFRDKCLPAEVAEELKWATARRAVEFLKLLDDPLERRCRIIFVTHGALSLGLADGWVKLALIQRAIRGRHGVKKLRRALARILGKLLRMSWVDRNGCGVWEALLSTNPRDWLDVLHKWEIDPEHDDDSETDDDPVPRAVSETLQELDTDEVYDALKQIPLKKSKYYNERIQDARHAINGEVRTLWKDCIESLQMRLPLLILDEAHHLKNPETRLASLFQVPEARDDADEITTRGTLGDVFERMLFLTATPFQLGHAELCSVLDRFGAIRWTGKHAPSSGLPTYQHKLKDLRTSLDRAQAATSALDHAWGRLRLEDLHIDGQSFDESRVDAWWKKLSIASDGSPSIKSVRERYASASDQMKMAERLLRPWVIRHLKPRSLPAPHQATPRRERFPGRTLEPGTEPNNTAGLPVADSSLLPFLLAARATSHAPDARPVFAEGLASSYEAFLHTRQANLKKKTGRTTTATLDTDDDPAERCDVTQPMEWYLDHLAALVPHGDPQASVAHPKVGATVRRVVDLWAKGEKVVVFCHYIATGRTLRQ
ncbi:MAG: hypothetical protein ACE5E4_13425, partial [Candidatus Binatia bacterium]